MRKTPSRLPLLLCVALLTVLSSSACSPSAPTTTVPDANESSLPYADQAEIYGLAVRQITGPDDTIEGDDDKAVIYLVRTTDDSIGDPRLRRSGIGSVPLAVQKILTSSLADLPSTIRWVDTFDDVKRDRSTGTVLDDAFIVQLGSIEVLTDGSVRVPTSIYFGNLGASGKTYLLKSVD